VKVDGTSSGSCPMAAFGTRGDDPSGVLSRCATTVIV
jgi:hypothetical protein